MIAFTVSIHAILAINSCEASHDEPWRPKYDATASACMNPIAEESLTLYYVRDPGIRALFTRERRYQSYLDVEGALAMSESDAGLVPSEAAREIAINSNLSFVNLSRVIELGEVENHPLMPLIGAFSEALNAKDNVTKAGGWVHWGATTQNIVYTGFTLALRRAFTVILNLMADLIGSLSRLAERTAEVVLAGRTHGQQAVPITFGFKVAGYLDELSRHVDRLLAAQPRLFVAVIGGAVGSMASFGSPVNNSQNVGVAVQQGVARRLGFGTMGVPARTALDHFVELVVDLAMLGTTCARVAGEVFELMQTEYGEVEEPVLPGTIGSSTMPQKRNPNTVEDILLLEGQLRGLVGPALQSMTATHEAMGHMPRLVSYTAIEAVSIVGDILAELNYTIGNGFTIHQDTMWKNVAELSRGLLMAERVMLALGLKIGRQAAHELVYKAAMTTYKTPGRFLNDTLWTDSRVRKLLDNNRTELELLMNPAGYVGESAHFAHDQAKAGIHVVEKLRSTSVLLDECASLWDLVREAARGTNKTDPAALEKRCSAIFKKRTTRPSLDAQSNHFYEFAI